MQSFWQDVRYGVRILWKSPGSTVVAIIALALGIGANTAIFSLVDAVLLRPLPYRDPGHVAVVYEDAWKSGWPRNTPAPANFYDWKSQNQVFEDMAASRGESATLTGGGEPETVPGRVVTWNLFSVLGVRPALGRTFSAEEDRPGAPPVAVIGYGLWQRRFGGEPDVVGKTVQIDGHSTTVIGIMPRGFIYPSREEQIWRPIAFSPEDVAARSSHYLHVVARLRPDATFERAQSDMSAIAARLEKDHPDSNTSLGATVVPIHDDVVGNLRPALLVLLAAVGCVLLIACANVANLLLSRATLRRREIAVRLALGASRMRIVRQLLTESLLLAAAGGALGIGIALWSFDFLDTLVPQGVSSAVRVGIDPTVLGFTLLACLGTGILFGLAPALAASRPDLAEQIKASGPHAASGKLRGVLVVTEVALAFLLLAGSGLLVQTFMKVRALDPGFRADHVLTMRTVLPSPRYDEKATRLEYYDRVLANVQALPGVKTAGFTSFLPLTMPGGASTIVIDGRPPPAPGESWAVNERAITPDYTSAMSMSLAKGRFLARSDSPDSARVVLVNESFVRRYFPDEEPLGKRFRFGRDIDPWMTIVGVVGDVRQMGLEKAAREEMYLPYTQLDKNNFLAPKDLAVKTTGDPMALAESVRKAIWAVDPLQPVARVRAMDALLDEEMVTRSVQARLLGGFAVLALVLASLGIYGVLSYAVAQRRREIGIRMALGARAGKVVGMVVGQGVRLTALGIVIGLVVALVVMRALSSVLYGVSASDPLTYIVVAASLLGVALVASFVPARQASRVDPMIAFKDG